MDCEVFVLFFARSISSFLISKGLSVSNLRSVRRSAIEFLRVLIVSENEKVLLGHEHDENHAPDRQQGVPNGIGNRIPEPWDLTFGTIIDHAERGSRGSCTGTATQHYRIIELEQVFADIHCENEWHCRDRNTPQEEAQAT